MGKIISSETNGYKRADCAEDVDIAATSLVLKAFSVKLADRYLFAPIDLTIQAGNVTSLMGVSGAGKSTLLAAIAGTINEEFSLCGDLLLNRKSLLCIPPHLRRVGLLFQDDLLFPHMSIAENLAFALPATFAKSERDGRITEALRQVEMQGYGASKPWAVSEGQRFRIALMRTLIAEPRVVLLDEPFSKLDSELRRRLRSWVFDHIRMRNIPALMVTHDRADARAADPKRIFKLH